MIQHHTAYEPILSSEPYEDAEEGGTVGVDDHALVEVDMDTTADGEEDASNSERTISTEILEDEELQMLVEAYLR